MEGIWTIKGLFVGAMSSRNCEMRPSGVGVTWTGILVDPQRGVDSSIRILTMIKKSSAPPGFGTMFTKSA